MKTETISKLSLLMIIGIVLLSIGCTVDTSKNGQNNSTEVKSNQNRSIDDSTITENIDAPPCTNVNESILTAKIQTLPAPLKEQFSSQNITFTYAANVLTFKGRMIGNGNLLHLLFSNFAEFRGPACVKTILLKGKTDNEQFEWCPTAACPTRIPSASCTVRNIVGQSRMKYQIGENLIYDWNKGNDGVLEFTGFAGSRPNSGQFTSLFAQLQGEMNKACVTRVTFRSAEFTVKGELLNAGFAWELCEQPNCECEGECKPCAQCNKKDDNSNSAANGNTGNSNFR